MGWPGIDGLKQSPRYKLLFGLALTYVCCWGPQKSCSTRVVATFDAHSSHSSKYFRYALLLVRPSDQWLAKPTMCNNVVHSATI